MSIVELNNIVSAPKKPIDKGTKLAWKNIQKDFQIQLPQDLFEFGQSYGTGFFCGGYIQIFNPFWEQYREIIDAQLDRLRNETILIKFNLFPTSPGLFPVGRDESGGHIYWLTEGHPDRWPVLFMDDMCEVQKWDMSLTSFLSSAFLNRIQTSMWQPFQKEELYFKHERG